MKKIENNVSLSQKKAICLNQGKESNKNLAIALNAELALLGFFLNKKAFSVVASQSKEEILEVKNK